MKRKGILNVKLSEAIAKMGHGDMILIGDAGCPFPRHDMTTQVDLAVTAGIPMVNDVLKIVMEELEVESYIVSQETKDMSPDTYNEFKDTISKYKSRGEEITEKTIKHTDFKDLWLNGALNGEEMKVFVRTGEKTPYGYIILVGGVNFTF